MSRSLSKKACFEIFKRDGFACRYCGATPPTLLEVDHVKPVCKGGSDEPENLVTACFDCNRGKAGNELEDLSFSVTTEESLTRESEILAQSEAYVSLMAKKRKKIKSMVSEFCKRWEELHNDEEELTEKGKASVKMFISKIGLDQTLDSLEIAFQKLGRSRDLYRYFCGVAHNKIKYGPGGIYGVGK